MRAKLWVLAAIMGGLALPAQAHELTMSECLEGSDFIKNAALSRDYGMSREDFLGRMQSDLVAIQAFPPELRWFVQDEDDETLLVGFAQRVFDSPQGSGEPSIRLPGRLRAAQGHAVRRRGPGRGHQADPLSAG